MKKIIVFMLVSMMIASSYGQKIKSLKTAKDSLAYAIGISVYQNVEQLNVEMDVNMIAGALKAAEADKAFFTPDEANAFIQQYMMGVERKRIEENKEAGNKFLEENKKTEGVIVTESGLQYIVLQAGDGPKPVAEDQVTVHYTGTLMDGTVFDSSVERGEPTTFGLGQVIKGWGEVLQLMPVGSKYKVFIPSDLAYGDRGAGQDIKPGSMLIFEIELLEIVER